MKRILGFHFCALLAAIFAPTALAADGDWPMWRHDTALTGYQNMPGAMRSEPRILARHFVGAGIGVPTFADLLRSGRDSEILIVAGSRLDA
jgi:hypothetical protein